MSDNIRIRTEPGGNDKYVSVNVKQKFDFIEILSLKISQDEAYRRFCSDYGVVVGRVIVNNGVGVPNAKVSIFIPIDEEDKLDPEVLGLYPFEVVTDKDDNGVPYNLLPRNNTGKDDCYAPIGNLYSKRQFLDNPQATEIYCKYYKFTTTTNDSGDFMLFGVPVGTHYLHVDADISDIGFLSIKPYELIAQGADKNSFASPTKYKDRSDNVNLTQLKTISPVSVTVSPFWGDTEECEIGISRLDVDLKTRINPSAIFMGSIITDNDKQSINKRCRPKKKMGKMSELVTGAGRIEMIRKNLENRTERYDIEGGELIDESGTWAYQVPMNLDYVVTSETGELVASNDPSRGIPTRARVRFRVGINTDGKEGRLRSRAKYLIPHNPKHSSQVDYDFGDETRDESFTDMYWNKIYSIKNYIPRLQPNGAVENRNFTGIKDVLETAFSPFPFNRMDTDINPLFGFLCILLNIFVTLVCVLQSIIITINIVIFVLNWSILLLICLAVKGVASLTCGLKHLTSSTRRKRCRCDNCIARDCTSGNCKCVSGVLPYIPYITLGCSADPNGQDYAPCGWKGTGTYFEPVGATWDATYRRKVKTDFQTDENGELLPGQEPDTGMNTNSDSAPDSLPATPFHYPNDGHPGHRTPGAGWIECQALALADSLEVFKFDFYNDWVNGTLYAYMFKMRTRKKGRGKQRFCEVDCGNNTLGVDNNDDGQPDNQNCRRNYILDTCTGGQPQNDNQHPLVRSGVKTHTQKQIRHGYIKYYEKDKEYYYVPISPKTGNRMFASDIISLGSSVECDWQGIPKLYEYLVPTTCNPPPLSAEYDPFTNCDGTPSCIDVTGIDTKLSYGLQDRLVANVVCVPIAIFGGFIITKETSCVNLRRFCELGMGLDENRSDETPSRGYVDNKISNEDVENPFIRGAFAFLNGTPYTYIPTGSNVSKDVIGLIYVDAAKNASPYLHTGFGYNNAGYQLIGGTNQTLYKNFRNGVNRARIVEHDNSFYFYFGLFPGNNALGKMKRKYFTDCPVTPVDSIFVVATEITEDDLGPNGTGEISINIVGGTSPYTIIWGGPTVDGTPYAETFTNVTTSENTISDLFVGQYNVTVVDAYGNTANGTFYVPGPAPVQCSAQGTNASNYGASDGSISVNIVSGGGQPPYTVKLFSSSYSTPVDVTTATPDQTNTISAGSLSTVFNNLTAGLYEIVVTDSGTPTTQCETSIEISEPDDLGITINLYNVSCHGALDGQATVSISGGTTPYKIIWDNTPTISGTSINNLGPGSHTVKVIDDNGDTATANGTITQPNPLTYNLSKRDNLCQGGTGGKVSIDITSANGPVEITVDGITKTKNIGQTADFTGLETGQYNVDIVDTQTGCRETENLIIDEPSGPVNILSATYEPPIGNAPAKCVVTAIGGWASTPNSFIANTLGNSLAFKWEAQGVNSNTWNNTSQPTSITSSSNGVYTCTLNLSPYNPIGTKFRCQVLSRQPAPKMDDDDFDYDFNSQGNAWNTDCVETSGVMIQADGA